MSQEPHCHSSGHKELLRKCATRSLCWQDLRADVSVVPDLRRGARDKAAALPIEELAPSIASQVLEA